jgi:hypothetical protein
MIINSQLERQLKVFRANALSLSGVTTAGRPLGVETAKFFDDLLKNSQDPEHLKKRTEFMQRAEKDPAVREQLCGIRIENFQNYVLPALLATSFHFDVVNLNPDERPVHQNSAMQETKIWEIGPDGESRMVRINREDVETLISLKWLSTETVRYRLVDIYRGSVVDAALQTINLSLDMSNKRDALAQKLLDDTAFGAFKFTGKRSGWTFVPNSRVNMKNIPATNDVAVSGTSNKFGFLVLDAIIDYAARMGSAYPDGGFGATGRIRVAPLDIKGIAGGITPSGAKPAQIAEELIEAGYFSVNYMGKNWLFVPDNTLDPDLGYCYPEFSKKAGRVYLKPSLDREELVDNTELRKRNEQEKYIVSPFGCAMNEACRPMVARFDYKP